MVLGTELLGYLHDATVIGIVFELAAGNCRSLTLTVECVPDAGYAPWNGQRVIVRMHDVLESRHVVVGAMAGKETVDRFELAGESFAISFHSGSELRGVCRRIEAELAT